MSELSEERIQELVEEAERGYDPKTIKPRDVPFDKVIDKLDDQEDEIEALQREVERLREQERRWLHGEDPHRTLVTNESYLGLIDAAQKGDAARERIEQLEGEVERMASLSKHYGRQYEQQRERAERLGKLLDEALPVINEVGQWLAHVTLGHEEDMFAQDQAVEDLDNLRARIEQERSSHDC